MMQITCPHCQKEFELSSAFESEYKSTITKDLELTHKKELEEAKRIALESVSKRLHDEFELKIKTTQEDILEKDKRIKILIEEMSQMTKELREAKRDREDAKLEMEKKLIIEEEKIRLEITKKAEEEQHTKLLAKDKQLQDTLKELEDAKRKLEQGSQQTQGEVFELEFEQFLSKQYPHDKFTPVAKGVRGGDIIQEVWDANGNYTGKILWELKNTKTWNEQWIEKLKNDKREIGAEEAMCISTVLPSSMKYAGFYKGVWVTKSDFVIPLTDTIRAKLIQLYYAKKAAEGRDSKAEILYRYLSGTEFRNRIEAIVESFTGMQQEIEKEKRYFANKWARDEKNIRHVIDSTYSMHGDLKAIMGSSLSQIKELDLLESGEKI